MDKTFIQLSRAWYAEPNIRIRRESDVNFLDEITIQLRDDNNLYGASFDILNLGGHGSETVEFNVFDDGFDIFSLVPELFIELAEARNLNCNKLIEILKCVGFKDATPTKVS